MYITPSPQSTTNDAPALRIPCSHGDARSASCHSCDAVYLHFGGTRNVPVDAALRAQSAKHDLPSPVPLACGRCVDREACVQPYSETVPRLAKSRCAYHCGG